jgi:hypothetical protein
MSWRQQIQRGRQISSSVQPRGVTTVAVHTGTVVPAVAVPNDSSLDVDAIPSANAVVVDTCDDTPWIELGSIPPPPPTVDEARIRDLIDVINSTIPLTLEEDDNNVAYESTTWWQRFPLYFVLCPILFFAAIMMGLAIIRASRNGEW